MSDATVPESRAYRHVQCDNETVVSGQPFELVSNPMSSITQTWCSDCNGYFPISDYQWSDTGENLSDYFARHTQSATDMQRFLCSKKFMVILWIIGFLLSALGATVLFADQALWVKIVFIPLTGLIGVLIASAVFISGFANPITRKVCGVEDTRTLT
ncbi:hypothetical protein FYK55_19330 [Roseiconus nitratireducens]|uniref:Uncharacterized protein n=1 Tax=Roseiconus nitratireducens TaxID=2605748 RepID=A0A5M6D378_9BACT|nr:hypothetical protein [Roseiconus nitratireducens]KAA5541050.1 hypothetical protein FYK55_19330 [Roseiconus nitratireducens]